MAHRKMILTETGAKVYRTRMLSAGDPVMLGASDARLFERYGWANAPNAPKQAPETRQTRLTQLDHDGDGKPGGSISGGDDLAALRAEYTEKFGKRPFMGWDADALRERIAAA